MDLLTKSKYMHGLVCPRYLWMEFHQPEKLPEVDAATQSRFDQGHQVGEMAKKCFPGGIDLSSYSFTENIKETKNALKKRKPIFEAGILAGNLFSRADILVPAGKEQWDIVEVKMTTQVKEEHCHDISFQRLCYEQSGLKIRNCVLMHINNEFVKQGEIDPPEFFTQEIITPKVDEAAEGIEERVKNMLKLIASPKFSENIAGGCTQPGECELEDCWKHLPEHNVFHLYSGKKKALELLQAGILALKDIPDSVKLNDKQQIQRDCARTGKPHIHKESIKQFLKSLKYPLCYLDFETFNMAIPLYDGTKPYQNIPFQFSLHVDDGKKVLHYGFLADGKSDPREKFIEELMKAMPEKGDIVVYNAAFEKGILNALAEAYPKHKKWIEELFLRFVDLLMPFRSFSYYHPEQKGSASIKCVLPALTGKDYEGLNISNGECASVAFLNMVMGDAQEDEQIRKDLEEYCGQDTEGMMWIVEELGKIV